MLKIHKQVRARKDIKGILEYSIKNWGEKQADKYYDELIKGMDLFVTHPEIGVARDDIREGYRCFRINQHDVYYKITSTRIVIIRVLHESMKPELHFKAKQPKK